MVYFQFIVSSIIIVVAAIKLAEYGDIISIRTGLGGLLIGLILMAGATSLPEFLTSYNSIDQGVPDLAAGNIFGSNMLNMFLLGFVDLIFWKRRILRSVIQTHALSASIAIALISLSIFFIIADIPIMIGRFGLDSIILILSYIVGIWLIQTNTQKTEKPDEDTIDESIPSLRKAMIYFAAATFILILVMPYLVSSSRLIADTSGLGTGFIGTFLVAFITSLPELVTTIAAIRMGVYDLAVGNLFGSNLFNIFSLGLADVFVVDSRFIAAISPDFLLVAVIGLVMTILGLIGNLAKIERKFIIIEIDSLLMILIYILGSWLIYLKGINI